MQNFDYHGKDLPEERRTAWMTNRLDFFKASLQNRYFCFSFRNFLFRTSFAFFFLHLPKIAYLYLDVLVKFWIPNQKRKRIIILYVHAVFPFRETIKHQLTFTPQNFLQKFISNFQSTLFWLMNFLRFSPNVRIDSTICNPYWFENFFFD